MCIINAYFVLNLIHNLQLYTSIIIYNHCFMVVCDVQFNNAGSNDYYYTNYITIY